MDIKPPRPATQSRYSLLNTHSYAQYILERVFGQCRKNEQGKPVKRDGHAHGALNFTLLIILFLSVHVFRDPFVDNGIAPTPKAGEVTNFTDNGAIAIDGLTAPVEIKDSYKWARDKNYASFIALQDFTNQYDLIHKVPVADVELDIQPDFSSKEQEFPDMDQKETAGYVCDSLQAKEKRNTAPCLTLNKTEELKKSYGVVWDRFEQLPAYKTCARIPTMNLFGFMDSRTYINLTKLKSADLYYQAKTGNAERAIKEWAGYMAFFRNCLSGDQQRIPLFALHNINFATMFSILNDILILQPKAIIEHQEEINFALRPFDETILVTPFLPVNEYLSLIPHLARSANENDKDHLVSNQGWPKIFQPAYPSNGFLKKVQKCEDKWKKILHRPIPEVIKSNFADVCEDDLPSSDLTRILLKSATTSGQPFGNFAHHLTFGGMLKGQGLAINMRRTQGRMTAARLGIDLRARGIPANKIESEINLAPPSLYDPLTDKPFQYDSGAKMIYFKPDTAEEKEHTWPYSFYLEKPPNE